MISTYFFLKCISLKSDIFDHQQSGKQSVIHVRDRMVPIAEYDWQNLFCVGSWRLLHMLHMSVHTETSTCHT